MKKLKVLAIVGFSILCGVYGFFLGTTQVSMETKTYEIQEVIPEGYINAESEDFLDSYVDMGQVVDYEIFSEGLQLYFKDGSGYWLEK